MSHINITQTNSDNLAAVMLTKSSNSFGDQILKLKVLVNNSRYETIKTNTEHEGNHINNVKNWALQSMQMLFLDWFNNFLSVYNFAQHHGMSDDAAFVVINEGKQIHESLINLIKSQGKNNL